MKKRMVILTVWVGLLCLSGISTVFAQSSQTARESASQESPKTDMTHDKGDSIVRYDIIDVAKNLMSCAAYYDVIDDTHSGEGFVKEVKWIFMVDATQTEEETASWIATANGLFHKYWSDMKDEESFESQKAIETQRIECWNLGVSRKIFGDHPEIEQVQ